ncbi:hypothetical protein HDU97_008136 [Phlyctochytrium planicorne]|nr:hypothetical protein HDU97_008136 [Phlyctochytrium planicorne]
MGIETAQKGAHKRLPSILLLGASEVLIDVVNGLVAKSRKSDIKVSQLDQETTVFPLTITTKYYTQDVQIYAHASTALTSEFDLTLLDDVVGLIYVCEEAQISTTKEIDIWNDAFPPNAILFRIIVTQSDGEVEEAIEDWCFDNQAEIVSMTRNEEDNKSGEGDAFDKFGIDRIMEVLENNLWEVSQNPKNQEEDLEDDNSDGIPDLGIELEPEGLDFLKGFRKSMKDESMFDLENTIVKLQQMKAYGETLSEEKRKDFAAMVSVMVAGDLS